MKRLVVSQAAQADLASIADHTEQRWGRAQRVRYLAEFKDVFATIRKSPAAGMPRDDIRQGLRSMPCGQHVLFYRAAIDSIEIVRVLHQRMDVHRHLRDT